MEPYHLGAKRYSNKLVKSIITCKTFLLPTSSSNFKLPITRTGIKRGGNASLAQWLYKFFHTWRKVSNTNCDSVQLSVVHAKSLKFITLWGKNSWASPICSCRFNDLFIFHFLCFFRSKLPSFGASSIRSAMSWSVVLWYASHVLLWHGHSFKVTVPHVLKLSKQVKIHCDAQATFLEGILRASSFSSTSLRLFW